MEIVLTPAQMRAADEATIASGTPGTELMDRAAHACATVALRMLGGAYGRRVVAVCGKGNNGGDGIACARHLASAGVHCTVLMLGEPAGDAAHHLRLARRSGGSIRFAEWSVGGFERAAAHADLVVDAVLGTGSRGEPTGKVGEALAEMERSAAPVLAVDIPSGVSGTDGSVPGVAMSAQTTLAIQALKPAHVCAPGAFRCGRIEVVDIGIPADDPGAYVPRAPDVASRMPQLRGDTHKYEVGALAILAGSAGMTGAAILAARGASRSGTGLVILGVPASALEVAETAVTEAIKVPLPHEEGQLLDKAVDELADRIQRARALAVGPGLGRGPRAVSLMRRVLELELPLVIDADGLWALGEIMREDPGILSARSEPSVLTPHAGEFAFLAGRPPSDDRMADVRERASEWGAVVHLKGRRAITAHDGRVWVNTTGNPGAATGGTGDVLTGLIASLLAQEIPAPEAAWMGAFVHGRASDRAAALLGRRGMTSPDVAEAIPSALASVAVEPAPRGRIRTVVGRDDNT